MKNQKTEPMIEKRARRVLIVDDDDIIRSLIRLSLTGIGSIEFAEASNGLSALSLVRQFTPDVIIADLMMPVMDGVTFTSSLRRSTDEKLKNIPVIVVTGGSDELKSKAYAAGANYVIEKPLTRRVIVEAFKDIFHK